MRVTCTLAHVDGHARVYTVDLPADGIGAKGGAVMTRTHAAGSAMTYGRRYLLQLMFNLATGDDDDGNGAGSRTAEFLTPEQIDHLRTRALEVFQRSDPSAWTSCSRQSAAIVRSNRCQPTSTT